MVTGAQQVFNEIKEYIRKKGGIYHDWYTGTTSNVREGLFLEHNVSEKSDFWIYRDCENLREAKRIKEILITLGCKGKAEEWEISATSVYAYRKSSNTIPQ